MTDIRGTPGGDQPKGTALDDVLNGFAGDDTLDGGTGADKLVGGTGNDIYYVDNPGDVMVEAPAANTNDLNGNFDYVISSVSLTAAQTANVEGIVLVGCVESALLRPGTIVPHPHGARPKRRSRRASSWSMSLLMPTRQWFAWLAHGWRMRRTIRVLAALDDRTLGDIGLAREDIGYVAQYGGVPPSSARKSAANYPGKR